MLKAEWTNRDALGCNNITCANCQYNDGVIYTSIPPQYKCTITNEFHHNNDKCDVEFAPVKHGHWKPFGSMHRCSICEETVLVPTTLVDIPTYDYCPNCGAKMDEVT